jgi:frataxin-like iron-binding protein CyaY
MNAVLSRSALRTQRIWRTVPSLVVRVDKPFYGRHEQLQAVHGTIICSFHSSLKVKFAERRRRRGDRSRGYPTSDTEELIENPLRHDPVTDVEDFSASASILLAKLEKALMPMKAKNDVFVVTRRREELGDTLSIDLTPKDGSYIIEINEEEQLLSYTSPISGTHLYILSAKTREWVGAEDGHAFEGLLVRDLIRQCQGLPDL